MTQCPICHIQIPEGEVICPNCGHELQLVPTYETLASSMIEKANREKEEEEQKIRDALLIEEEEKYFRKNRRKRLIISAIVAVACIVTVILLVRIWQNNANKETVVTYDDYYTQALAAYNNGEFEHAAGLLNEALKLQPGSSDALILQAKITFDLGNKYDAISQLKDVIAANPEAVEAYRELIEIYQSDNDSESIHELLETCPESMREALSDYISGAPIFSMESGTYNTEIDVTITSTGVRIYYTTDGSIPSQNSAIYTDPVHLTEGKTYLKAVSETDTGVLSTVTEAEYNIDRNAPDPPALFPSSGTYYGEDNEIVITVPAGCTCYYAFDAKPTTDGEPYTKPIEMLEGDHIFYAILVNEQGVAGAVSAATYIYRSEDPYAYEEEEEYTPGDSQPVPTEAPIETDVPTETLTEEPTDTPTKEPTAQPTKTATPEPTKTAAPEPTEEPTPEPTEKPTPEPTEKPTPEPTEEPTPEPTEEPTPEPTEEPTPEPTEEPTPEPTEEPTPEPTEEPTPEPTGEPDTSSNAPAGAQNMEEVLP